MPLAQDKLSTQKIDEFAKQAHEASTFLKTLGHTNRLLVLCILVEGEKSVGEIAMLLNLPQPNISQLLMRLRFEKLVSARREARTVYYSIACEKVKRVVALLHELFCAQ